MNSAAGPGTKSTLCTPVLSCDTATFRGSTTAAPLTMNRYRYAFGSSGPTVADHTPLSAFASVTGGWPKSANSPRTATSVAEGAKIRNATRPSLSTSGETTVLAGDGGGAGGACGVADLGIATSAAANTSAPTHPIG